MPRKSTTISAVPNVQDEEENFSVIHDDLNEPVDVTTETEHETAELRRMLAAVLEYLSDDEVEEIDIEVILDKTAGLRDWWDAYRESNKKEIEDEIARSLAELSLKDLESLREQIKGLKEQ